MPHVDPVPPSSDARTPRDIARQVEQVGVAKARTDALTLFVLALLAGAFISIGALLFVFVTTGSAMGFGLTRWLGGMAFSLGLVLTVVAGAELFTGNNLLAMAWASGLIDARAVLRNWGIVYAGNVAGCLGTVALALAADAGHMGVGVVGETAIGFAAGKAGLSFGVAFARGVLCNALVCLAVWLTLSGRTVADKILAVIFPVAAFVAMGFEHSIANWFFLPFGAALDTTSAVSRSGIARNLLATTLGNVAGGTLLVAGVYWVAYLRPGRRG